MWYYRGNNTQFVVLKPLAHEERRLRQSVKTHIAVIAFPLLALAFMATQAFAALKIEATYLYDLQGPTKDSQLQNQRNLYCDLERAEVYVVDTGNHCIRVFGKEGMQLFQFGHNGDLAVPLDVVINSQGDIYVLQSGPEGKGVIDVFDFRGKYLNRLELKDLPEGEDCRPNDIAIDSQDNVYVSDQRNGCIVSFDRDGHYRFSVLPPISEKEREEVVFGSLMIDDGGNVYLPVGTLGIVFVFDGAGQFVRNFGIKGGGPGKLAFPIDVAVDKHGHCLVLDHARHCISVYDKDGRYMTEFGGMGTGPGWFFYPSGLEIDKYGRIYVSQTFGNRVQVLKLKEAYE
ncbi:MAG: 6-bladed beta-propeller [Candidatus Abyssobacteria bacterium SURF_17]|jgi:hypothetical protein|uniref:6-bladed beta-propeller n=1 Tax=Candidatus Abyssobacteria bacterium SURF_17 TaxID=2093361 RepID=A0A419F282_9BACT|nr:MAG: 6-bladed beta-propeller [Candidatus Abyssubacteria bacterium SURF_17]